MNAIDRIKNRFEIKLPDQAASEPVATSHPPCRCGHTQHWRAHHQTDWRCVRCTPPPARAFVAEWWPAEPATTGGDSRQPAAPAKPTITAQLLVTYCKPWCDHCGGWQGIETTWSDDSHRIECRTCRAEMPEVPRERPVKENKKTDESETQNAA